MERNSRNKNPGDQVTEALLEEHARLGTGRDEELVAAVLSETIEASRKVVPFAPQPKPPASSVGDWIKVAAIVVAFVGSAVFLLSRSPRETANSGAERTQETFHFVIKVVDPTKSGSETAPKKKLRSGVAGPSRESLPVAIGHTGPGVDGLELAEADLSPPGQQFGQSIEDLPAIASMRASFMVASNETAKVNDRVTYSGDVVLNHEEFTLQADSLVMEKEDEKDEIPVLSAKNARLIHREGVYETTARSIFFDPETGELVASGVSQLLRHGSEQPVEDTSARVYFGSHDYAVVTSH